MKGLLGIVHCVVSDLVDHLDRRANVGRNALVAVLPYKSGDLETDRPGKSHVAKVYEVLALFQGLYSNLQSPKQSWVTHHPRFVGKVQRIRSNLPAVESPQKIPMMITKLR